MNDLFQIGDDREHRGIVIALSSPGTTASGCAACASALPAQLGVRDVTPGAEVLQAKPSAGLGDDVRCAASMRSARGSSSTAS